MIPGGYEMAPNAVFFTSKDTKEFLLVKFCNIFARIQVIFRRTEEEKDGGRIDRRGSRNNYQDWVTQENLLPIHILT